MELYRYFIDDFLIQYCQKLGKKDFTIKTEILTRGKKGKREYLNKSKTDEFMRGLNQYFENFIDIPRIKIGKRQTIETLINEEALLFAKFLIKEKETWIARVAMG